MTNEEAIKAVTLLRHCLEDYEDFPLYIHDSDLTALDMAISALKQFEGMTNKEAIRELFPSIELGEIHNGRHRFFLKGKEISTFDLRADVKWLNTPYQKGGE